MSFFWKRQEDIEARIDKYFDQCDACLDAFEKAFALIMDVGQGEAFEAAVQKTHEAESSADDLRRELELTLYGKALLPESRGDLLGLLETYDQLPNMAQTVLFALRCQRVVFPKELLTGFKNLVQLNLQAYGLARKCVDELFHNPKVILYTARDVDSKESESDRAERQMICSIFDSGMDIGTKLMFKELVLLIGHLSDLAEAVADRVSIIAIKRQV